METRTNRIGILAIVAAVLAVAAVILIFRGDEATPAGASDADRVSTPAPIESVDVAVLESSPPQYVVNIVSGLPSGCAEFEKAEVTGRSGTRITISVTNTMPASPVTVCTMIYGTHPSAVHLGNEFESGTTYTVDVNGTLFEFTAQ